MSLFAGQVSPAPSALTQFGSVLTNSSVTVTSPEDGGYPSGSPAAGAVSHSNTVSRNTTHIATLSTATVSSVTSTQSVASTQSVPGAGGNISVLTLPGLQLVPAGEDDGKCFSCEDDGVCLW